MIEKPATSSFVSVNGPSMTVCLSPLNFTHPSSSRRAPRREEDASLHELGVVLAHRGERFWFRQNARFGFLRCLDHDHETHCSLLNSVRVGCRALRGLTNTSNETGRNRHERREILKLFGSKT